MINIELSAISIRRFQAVTLERGLSVDEIKPQEMFRGGALAQVEKTRTIASVIKNMGGLGFTASKKFFRVLWHETLTGEIEHSEPKLIVLLNKLKGNDVGYRPFYPGFPLQKMNLSEVELFLHAVFHYMTDGEWRPDDDFSKIDVVSQRFTPVKIDVLTEDEFISRMMALVLSPSPVSETDVQEICYAMIQCAMFVSHVEENLAVIPNKELKARICAFLMKNKDRFRFALSKVENAFRLGSVTDVLRFAIALQDGDVSLATVHDFKSYTRWNRRFLLEIINDLLHGGVEKCEEDVCRHPQAWIRLGEKIHPGEFKTRYRAAFGMFYGLRNGNLSSFNSQVEVLIKDEKYLEAAKLLVNNPGEFARRLAKLFSDDKYNWKINARGNYIWTEILELFQGVAAKVSPRVLIQLTQSFIQKRSSSITERIVFPKGSTSKAYVLSAGKSPKAEICQMVIGVCYDALHTIYYGRRNRKFDGMTCYIDPKLSTIAAPLSLRSNQRSFQYLARGSRSELADTTKVLRTFIHWENMDDKNDYGSRVDIDLSATLYTEDFNGSHSIYYGNLGFRRSSAGGTIALHSGDLVDAPAKKGGACEFIDLYLDEVKNLSEYRYVAFTVRSYTGQTFDTIPHCYFGTMEYENVQGKVFDPATVNMKIDVLDKVHTLIPIVYDIKERTWIIVDTAVLDMRRGWRVNNERTRSATTEMLVKNVISLPFVDLGALCSLFASANGMKLVSSREDADFRFDTIDDLDTENVSPFNVEEMMKLLL